MSLLLRLVLIGTLLAALAAAAGGVYLQGRKDGKAECVAADARERDIARLAAESAAQAAAAAIGRIRVHNTTITNEVQREISERVVYRDCQHTAEQLQRINAALTGASAPEPSGRGLVPRADALGGPVVRGDDAQAAGGGRAVP